MSATENKINWKKVDECSNYGANPKGCIYVPYGYPDFVNPFTTAFATDGVDIDPKWELPKKVAVTTAITGNMFNKSINPNLPETPEEITKSIREVIKAGGQCIHVHVHDEYNMPSLEPELFHQVIDPLREEFPNVRFDGCIVPSNEKQWNQMTELIKEKFFDVVIVNTLTAFNGDALFSKPPHLMIEKTRLALENDQIPLFAVNNPGDIDNADRYLIKTGLMDKQTYWGVLPALPGCCPMHSPKAMVEGLMIMVNRIREIDPNAVIQVCCAGRASGFLATMGLLLGCNIRVGMEDTVYKLPSSDEIISSNAERFIWAKNMAESLGYEVATGEEWVKQVRGEIKL